MPIHKTYGIAKIADRRFNHKAHAKRILKRAIENLPKETYLQDIAYDDKIRPDQIAKLFRGDECEVFDEVDENFAETTWHAEQHYIEDVVRSERHRDMLERHGLMDDLRDVINDRNQSAPVDDLLRHTGNVLMRYDLEHDVPPTEFASEEELDEWAGEILEVLGIDEANLDAIRTTLIEASYGGRLFIIWHADVQELWGGCVTTGDEKWTWDTTKITSGVPVM